MYHWHISFLVATFICNSGDTFQIIACTVVSLFLPTFYNYQHLPCIPWCPFSHHLSCLFCCLILSFHFVISHNSSVLFCPFCTCLLFCHFVTILSSPLSPLSCLHCLISIVFIYIVSFPLSCLHCLISIVSSPCLSCLHFLVYIVSSIFCLHCLIYFFVYIVSSTFLSTLSVDVILVISFSCSIVFYFLILFHCVLLLYNGVGMRVPCFLFVKTSQYLSILSIQLYAPTIPTYPFSFSHLVCLFCHIKSFPHWFHPLILFSHLFCCIISFFCSLLLSSVIFSHFIVCVVLSHSLIHFVVCSVISIYCSILLSLLSHPFSHLLFCCVLFCHLVSCLISVIVAVVSVICCCHLFCLYHPVVLSYLLSVD